MNIKTCGIALAIMTCLLISIGSGDFIGEPIQANAPSWSENYEPLNVSAWTGPGWFGVGYEPITFGSGWISGDYEPFVANSSTFNLGWFGYDMSQFLYPVEEKEITPLEPEPVVLPQPLSISKEELFKSKPVISTQKQSLISSLKSGESPSIFF
jgi:hypothetical protein